MIARHLVLPAAFACAALCSAGAFAQEVYCPTNRQAQIIVTNAPLGYQRIPSISGDVLKGLVVSYPTPSVVKIDAIDTTNNTFSVILGGSAGVNAIEFQYLNQTNFTDPAQCPPV
jgi:hypothetical protein